MYTVLRPHFFGTADPNFYDRMLARFTFYQIGKVWLSSVYWLACAKPGNEVECRIDVGWVKTLEPGPIKAVCGRTFRRYILGRFMGLCCWHRCQLYGTARWSCSVFIAEPWAYIKVIIHYSRSYLEWPIEYMTAIDHVCRIVWQRLDRTWRRSAWNTYTHRLMNIHKSPPLRKQFHTRSTNDMPPVYRPENI